MRKEEFCKALGDINENYVKEARAERKVPKSAWLKWGAAAACLCLLVTAAIVWNNAGMPERPPESGDGGGPGDSVLGGDGLWPEGVDPVVASVAVIPAGESLLNVADAALTSIDEEDAKSVEILGNYIPAVLPEGVRYGPAGYYETTMKDGTRYHMIRVTYERGQAPVSAPGPENAQVSSPTTGNTAFLWMVWGHRPDTDRSVYRPGEITAKLLEQQEGVFYIDYDGIYVGISQMDIETDNLLAVIASIG